MVMELKSIFHTAWGVKSKKYQKTIKDVYTSPNRMRFQIFEAFAQFKAAFQTIDKESSEPIYPQIIQKGWKEYREFKAVTSGRT
tara:strand:- start:563 stop:814 length:252 start_codon:yes stop_codon:yes gene_type:complete